MFDWTRFFRFVSCLHVFCISNDSSFLLEPANPAGNTFVLNGFLVFGFIARVFDNRVKRIEVFDRKRMTSQRTVSSQFL